MSGASVCVLTPNGRRQTIKCTPNTTLLQILEQVCHKHDFKPEEYDLKHHNKILDTSQIFRFSGLPNNAQLEMVQALKNRVEQDITLCVNLENGNRITDSFKPNDTLLNILNKLCPESLGDNKHPVVIFTRREVYGKELENCTLRSLGLTSGRAMIRVINRDPSTFGTQANISAPIPTKPVEEKPYIRKLQPVENFNTKTQISLDSNDLPQNESIDNTPCIFPQKNIKKQNTDIIKLAKEKRKAQENSLEYSNDTKKQSFDNNDSNVDVVDKMDVDASPSDIQTSSPCHKKQQKKLHEEDFIFLGARHAMLFSLESAPSLINQDLPDDFFELTIDDAKKLLKDVRKRQLEMENAPLQTSALRNLEENKKQLRTLNKYKQAIIRIQFPNRVVLQGTFKPSETVEDIHTFVKQHLSDSTLDFHLYTTPPKHILEKQNGLLDLGLVPGALVYFGTLSNEPAQYLRQDLLDKFTTNSVASLAAAKIRKESTRKVDENDVENDDVDMSLARESISFDNEGASTSSGITHGERKINKSENMPKWFRPL